MQCPTSAMHFVLLDLAAGQVMDRSFGILPSVVRELARAAHCSPSRIWKQSSAEWRPVWPSVPNGVPKMIRYSVMDAWMMYMLPMAPPALLNSHCSASGLMAVDRAGEVVLLPPKLSVRSSAEMLGNGDSAMMASLCFCQSVVTM
jgi:hypothetical protein